jgi:hypothetical protein
MDAAAAGQASVAAADAYAYACDAAPPTVEATTSHRRPPSAIPLPSGSN